MKLEYYKDNLYTMKDLVALCNKSNYVVIEQIYWTDIFDYRKCFNNYYKMYKKINIILSNVNFITQY